MTASEILIISCKKRINCSKVDVRSHVHQQMQGYATVYFQLQRQHSDGTIKEAMRSPQANDRLVRKNSTSSLGCLSHVSNPKFLVSQFEDLPTELPGILNFNIWKCTLRSRGLKGF